MKAWNPRRHRSMPYWLKWLGMFGNPPVFDEGHQQFICSAGKPKNLFIREAFQDGVFTVSSGTLLCDPFYIGYSLLVPALYGHSVVVGI